MLSMVRRAHSADPCPWSADASSQTATLQLRLRRSKPPVNQAVGRCARPGFFRRLRDQVEREQPQGAAGGGAAPSLSADDAGCDVSPSGMLTTFVLPTHPRGRNWITRAMLRDTFFCRLHCL